MADSNLAVDPADITDLQTATANDQDVVDANFAVFLAAFNASLETSTGHRHDGSDSRLLTGGATGWTQDDVMLAIYSGIIGKGGI